MQNLSGAFEIYPGAGRQKRREMRQTALTAPSADQVAVRHIERQH
jgi:hypothetical protein